MRDFRKLQVWEKAHELVLAVYRRTAAFPDNETFELTRQVRRAAASIPTNIAEGYGRCGDGELGQFISIALGSAAELEYQLRLARDLQYLGDSEHEEFRRHLSEVQRMLTALQDRVRPRRAGRGLP